MASTTRNRQWYEKISRSGYFFGAVLLHLILFVMIGTWVIFPAFVPPQDTFTKTYLPTSSAPPPPPPPDQPSVQVPTQAYSTPTTTITSLAPSASFTVPIPNITLSNTPSPVQQQMTQTIDAKPEAMSPARLASIMQTEQNWGRDKQNILESNSDPRNITAKFPVYLAAYANGDWACNTSLDKSKKIVAGSLPNLIAKINEWSQGHITGEVEPTPLNLAGTDLLDKKPPFIFFTGHKDFVLTGIEIKNLQDYLQIGGCIWGDNALPGRGSRFDVAFRREMKRVVPDLDKNFEPVTSTYDVFTKSWFPIAKVPQGMNFYAEPLEHLDIDGKLAILYTPNDYSDMFTMRILPGDASVQGDRPDPNGLSPLFTTGIFQHNNGIFFRNYDLPGCLACDQMGMNIISYMLVRFDNVLQLAP